MPWPGNLHLNLGLAERTAIYSVTSPGSIYEAPSMWQTHVSSEAVSRSKPSFVLLESRPSLSLFTQHLKHGSAPRRSTDGSGVLGQVISSP